ncbi:putative peptidase S10, serine carboxypeptidase, alpha/Beta hydrolase [Rosa chinensis]|uniref:Putative peptidase S10, serine carboxypeptidase, alpha/Beta hydrolase n=1 Tax=Rosa chinensis TaxID=74649 RepID=A0A2P6PK70_ROSCH|nr:serine carboxypeptidase-like 18 [Rosa chinensis]PRQ22328.1 putative peptidase S10, serine carboxypeptidase, alpha/Beta hydrolase [Rosa chinensis]
MTVMLQAVLLVFLFHINAASRSIISSLPGFPGDLPFRLETGYIGVGDSDDVQLFYYFIESEGSPAYDPLVLWLTGGPGCSGFSGLVYESIGPLSFDYAHSFDNKPQLKLNPYSWTKVANIIFIDAPVGTGFSYTKTWDEYRIVNDTISAAQTYQFLRKWLVDHPRFISNPLYIAGDSYAGIVLPIIVQEISDGNEDGLEPAMNLQGYVLGNPVTDEVQAANSQVLFAYLKALISHDLYQTTKRNCKGEYVNVDPNNALCLYDLELVNECVQDVGEANILEPSCTFETPKPIGRKWHPQEFSNKDPIDLLLPSTQVSRPWCREYHYISSHIWANDKTVQSALHVAEGSIKEWVRCNTSLKDSYVKDVPSTVIYHKNLIRKGYRVLIYSGDVDMAIPYVGTFAWIESLNLTIDDEISWKPWFVNAQVAGYKTKYTMGKYELTYTTIKGAGHTAPEYKPEACLAMISRWFALYPL